MVIAKNIGRLGNNIFQICAAIGYARKYGYQWGVDPSNGHGEPYSAIHRVFPNLPKQRFGGGVRYHEHPHGICPQHGTSYDLCHFDYHEIPDLGPNVSLTGFYQSWKYFEHCKDEVKEVFKLDDYPEYRGCISIHVRRTDYVQHSGSFPPIDMNYILQALACVTHKNKGLRKIVFSDDIAWCKENMRKIQQVEFCEETDERKSLSMMSSCSHNIIANSSFSWWSAYLNGNRNKIVVSPSAETWFGENSGVKKPVHDLILPEWIQIPTR